jgi:selenocysteine-specific elongation factor
MHVLATAGHVDHGKSTLVRVLTGMDPDRWAEERRRGLTIDLGFAWTELPSGETVAFVDVPGHERFVPNMLAGAGPVPAVLLVVAADEGWMPQSAEHLAALEALGVRHGVLAITRTDQADPAGAAARARAELADTSLADVEIVAVSAPAGIGIDALRSALDRMITQLPPPVLATPVRLWVDRAFTIHGTGTVVTGTLSAGRIRVGDELELAGTSTAAGRLVRVRGLQSLGQATQEVAAVARVAVNLRGVGRQQVRRGSALLTSGSFYTTDMVDVRVTGDPIDALPPSATLHIGSAALTVRVRPLGDDTARLRLPDPLPLHIGDQALLRDPGRHHIAGSVTVLDVAPPPLRQRGAAGRRATVLAELDGRPDAQSELHRRQLTTRSELARMGMEANMDPVAGEWLADPQWWQEQRDRLRSHVEAYLAEHPLSESVSVEVLRQLLGLPDRQLVEALVIQPLVASRGRVGGPAPELPDSLQHRVNQLRADLAADPFRAPPAHRLVELRLGPRELAAATRAGALIQIADRVVLAPDAPARAAQILTGLPQPFTLSQARLALDTTRRVAVPLLEHLDQQGFTRRLADDRRQAPAVGGRSG